LFAALKSAIEKRLSKAGLMLLCSSRKARLLVKRFEMTRKIEIERFSLTTSKQFDEVIAGVNAGIGHPDMAGLAVLSATWTASPKLGEPDLLRP
jgi:hypothetical protein